MSKHTPGPWLREGKLVYALHHNGDYKDGKPFLVNRFSTSIQAYISQGGTIEEAEANTNLIAAAPDLLEALQNLVMQEEAFTSESGIPLEDPIRQAVKKAKAAIAKAKGENNA